MRVAAGILLVILFGVISGCGPATMSGNNSQQVSTPTTITVVLQPVQPTSPAQVVATATSAYPITKWQLLVDSSLMQTQASSVPELTDAVALTPGRHQITAKAYNSAGASGSASVSVTIADTSTSTSTPGASSFTVTMKPLGSHSPVTVSATAQGQNQLTGWNIYVDSELVFKQNTSAKTISQSVSISSGQHQVIARAWDTTGSYASATVTVDISGSNATGSSASGGMIPTPPSTAKTWSQVEDKGGWIGCSTCANNTSATFWFKQGVTSPSLDGNSMEGYIKGGYKEWADDLFVYSFGDQSAADHVLWSVSFQWNASTTKQSNGEYVAQAIEFDTLFLDDGFKYMFGTQCDYASGYWDIWNNVDRHWQHTSVKCQKWGPGGWHTVTWYLERDRTHKTLHFDVLQVDSTQYKVDRWMPAVGTSPNHDYKIQWEQDTDINGDPWNMWVDQVKTTIW